MVDHTNVDVESLLSEHWHSLFTPEAFFQQLDIYQSTPLCELGDLASCLGVAGLTVKDERNRLGLGSFKSVGGVYAVACILQALLQRRMGERVAAEAIFSEQATEMAKELSFVCATAGHHGIAVAKAAHLFGSKAVVYVSDQVEGKFLQRLKDCGAEVRQEGGSYHESLLAAERAAKQEGLWLVSHNSWRGNRKVPQLIMRGYQLIATEIQRDLIAQAQGEFEKVQWPDYVFLHGGARGLAMGIAKTIRCNWPVQPKIIVVEYEEPGMQNQKTITDQLAHKQSALLAYEYLSEQADHFYTVTSAETDKAVAMLRDYQLDVVRSEAVGFAGIKSVLDHAGQMNWSVDAGDSCLFVISEMD